MTATRCIIHLEMDGNHEYFGSPASLYYNHTAEELGISQSSLNNFFCKQGKVLPMMYRNKICTIRKDILRIKPMTRGRKPAGGRKE